MPSEVDINYVSVMDTFKSVKYLFWVMIKKIIMAIKYVSHDRCSINSIIDAVSPGVEKNCFLVDKPREFKLSDRHNEGHWVQH